MQGTENPQKVVQLHQNPQSMFFETIQHQWPKVGHMGTTYTMEHELPFGICPVIIHGCCFIIVITTDSNTLLNKRNQF